MAKTKKKARKKSPKKKSRKKRSKAKSSLVKKLKRVPAKDYDIVWDKKRESCFFGHKSGLGGELGSGVNDVIEVYTDKELYYVLSMNFTEGYACVEAFDGEPGGCAFLCFALPEDVEELAGCPLEEAKPVEVAAVMIEEQEEDD